MFLWQLSVRLQVNQLVSNLTGLRSRWLGIVGMCKEHLGVALALKVPVFFVVTKVDICPSHVLQHSLATLSAILRKPGVKKKPFMVRLFEGVPLLP